MNYELEQTARSQLAPGEKLLWSGQPRAGLRLRAADALLIPFSLMWAGFAVFWELSVIKHGGPIFFELWGVPFVLIGLYIVFGRFFVDAWKRGRTYYALTDQRALIMSGLTNPQIRSLPLHTLSDVTLTERADGTGSITLGPATGPSGWFAGSGWLGTAKYQPPAFEMIENVAQVHATLRDALARATSVRT